MDATTNAIVSGPPEIAGVTAAASATAQTHEFRLTYTSADQAAGLLVRWNSCVAEKARLHPTYHFVSQYVNLGDTCAQTKVIYTRVSDSKLYMYILSSNSPTAAISDAICALEDASQ